MRLSACDVAQTRPGRSSHKFQMPARRFRLNLFQLDAVQAQLKIALFVMTDAAIVVRPDVWASHLFKFLQIRQRRIILL